MRNEEKVLFKDMTAEQRSAIIEAKLAGQAEFWSKPNQGWHFCNKTDLDFSLAYRIARKELIIPWDVIKPEYKWAAMDKDGKFFAYEEKPKLCEGLWFAESGMHCKLDALVGIDSTGVYWKESLVERSE